MSTPEVLERTRWGGNKEYQKGESMGTLSIGAHPGHYTVRKLMVKDLMPDLEKDPGRINEIMSDIHKSSKNTVNLDRDPLPGSNFNFHPSFLNSAIDNSILQAFNQSPFLTSPPTPTTGGPR